MCIVEIFIGHSEIISNFPNDLELNVKKWRGY